MLRSTVIFLFLGLKNMLLCLFFNSGFISFSNGEKMGFGGCALKVKMQCIWLHICIHRIFLAKKIRLKSILPENIKFIAFNEMLLPV